MRRARVMKLVYDQHFARQNLFSVSEVVITVDFESTIRSSNLRQVRLLGVQKNFTLQTLVLIHTTSSLESQRKQSSLHCQPFCHLYDGLHRLLVSNY